MSPGVNGSSRIGDDRLHEAFAYAAAGMAITSLDGHFIETNPAFLRILGRTEEELRHKTLESVTAPEDRERCTENLNRLLGGEIPSFVMEKRYLQPDGQHVWVRNSVALLKGADALEAHIITICDDITERRRAEQLLLESEKLAIVGRLAASIAHEINNPLEAVLNLLFLVRDAESLEEARRFAAEAENEIARVAEITTHTLRFHKQQTRPTSCDLAETLDSVLVLFHGKLSEAHILVQEEKGHAPGLTCYPGEIRQLFANLIRNAIEAMPQGGTLRVRERAATDWRSGQPGVRVTIADSGYGMTAETRARIYQPFFTTKGAEGTGLGLWVSSGILLKHHAAMSVRSRATPGSSGTVFSLIFPYGREQRNGTGTKKAPHPSEAQASSPSPETLTEDPPPSSQPSDR